MALDMRKECGIRCPHIYVAPKHLLCSLLDCMLYYIYCLKHDEPQLEPQGGIDW